MNLNSDLGEGSVHEETILGLIDSANIACGAHAGSMSISIATAWRCGQLGIEVGAHPGYEDRVEFGRVERALPAKEIEALVAFQVAGLAAVAPIASEMAGRKRSMTSSRRPFGYSNVTRVRP